MVDTMVIDVDELKKPEMNGSDQDNSANQSLKRKRASLVESFSTEERTARIDALCEELNGLFKYYREVLDQKLNLDLGECGSSNSTIACLLEESNLPLSKLVDGIYEKMKAKESITLTSVKGSVLFIGQRSFYGVPNEDADVLEDESESCLWCWETRDIKLMPKSMRGALKIQRTCRRKIHERITAVSALITTLQKLESSQNCRHELMKASERLVKALSEADIRLLVESMVQKNDADMAEKEVKQKEKLLIKQLEKNKREAEKEKKRIDRELQKEKWQSEKELKRLQDEAEKEERRREKEESEMRKQLRRQQEEAVKGQRRQDKEEAELKKQLALQKQASLMDRFLKRSKNNPTCQNDQSATKVTTSDSTPNRSEKMPKSVTLSMDSALSLKDKINTEDIRKLHLVSWRCLGYSVRSNRNQHWGIRRNPKTQLIKELKLTASRGLARDDEVSEEKFVDGWGASETNFNCSYRTNVERYLSSSQKCNRSKQLLQFDKSNRPAFFGIWPKTSQVVGPRHPFEKDPELDYDIDSDEEWEEEEPGESLSDCDKDDEEENLEEGYLKADDEDESEDGFFVPDGYLSENEGVQVDRKESDHIVEVARCSPSCNMEFESEEFRVLFRQQKYLQNLTEHGLRKNQPLIILNLMHEKAPLLTAEDLAGTPKLEQVCLQALSMCACPGVSPIEISIDNVREEGQEACTSNSKASTTPLATVAVILDSDLPLIGTSLGRSIEISNLMEVIIKYNASNPLKSVTLLTVKLLSFALYSEVSVIQSCPQGMNKVVECLQQKFPNIPKSQLRNKVREISDFVDNRWQVKKDILVKLGLSVSPEKAGGRMKSIATFFSKRCLPPAGKTINPNETSPETSQKRAMAVQLQGHADNHQ